METRQYVVRHRCGQPIGVYPSRVKAQAVADKAPSPARYGLRVAVAGRQDIIAALQQKLCPHIPRR
jgi:hypothetical protein